ncbi:hypothetical protein, partial [Pseudomonas coronafaciens]|uniref:hypothetical protein n=1 Tax=Pseudomonas coronafaciens TaxID=53409 RepID=UPI001C118251
HGEGGWLKELSVPRVGTVGYFCSASLGAIAIENSKTAVAKHIATTRTVPTQVDVLLHNRRKPRPMRRKI